MDNLAPSSGYETSSRTVVLLVEDEISMRSAIAEYLREVGFSVIEAADAKDAITVMLSRKQVDLVFSDIQMPGEIDGVGLANWVDEYFSEIPVLLSSGVVRGPVVNGNRTRAFIAKPYRLTEIERRIRKLLEE